MTEGSVLFKAIMNGFNDHASSTRATLWFVLFGVLCLVNIPVFVLYRKAKAERWEVSNKSQAQSDVEILAAYAAQQQVEKEAQAAKKPPVPPGQNVSPQG